MWKPPAYGLIQEQYWPDGWKILVCCLCLNLTTRKQMEPVVAELFRRWPTPGLLAAAPDDELADLIRPLGMWKKRTSTPRSRATRKKGATTVSPVPRVNQ